jgi:hypothetical protein
MADKHILTIDILRKYGTDLSVPREVEFNVVALIPIDEVVLREFASRLGCDVETEVIDDVSMATLTARLVITEQSIRPLSEAVERFCEEHGWDYQGWGAFTFK